MEIVILRVLTSSLKNKWYQYLPLVPLAFICIFIKTDRLAACTSLFLVFSATTRDPWDVSMLEEVLKFWHDGIDSLITSVTRSRGGTAGLEGLCQHLSAGTCVRALTSPQCSTRYCVYSSGWHCLSLGFTSPFSGTCLSEAQLCFLQFIPSWQKNSFLPALYTSCCITYIMLSGMHSFAELMLCW